MNKKRFSIKPSAKAKAVELLSRSDQSVRRLTDKLVRRDYGEEEIQETIEWLQAKHFIDDEAGCKRRFEYLYESSDYSVKHICAKLMQKGYPSDIVYSCVPDEIYDVELTKAAKVLRKKYKAPAAYQKMMQYLYSKGFSYEVARDSVEQYLSEGDNT